MSEQTEITNNSGEECYEKGIWKTNTVLQCPQIPNFGATRQSEGGDHADRVPVLGEFNQKSCLDSLFTPGQNNHTPYSEQTSRANWGCMGNR